MTKRFLTIQRSMIGFGAIIIGMLTFLGIRTLDTITDVKIGGFDYSRIVGGKDLVADILPPPLYPVDAFAFMHIIEGKPETLAVLKPRIARMHELYDERFAHWQREVDHLNFIEPDAWQAFSAELKQRGDALWSEIETVMIPSIERGDMIAAEASVERMSNAFLDHGLFVEQKAAFVSDAIAGIEAEHLKEAEEQKTIMVVTSTVIGLLVTLMLLASHQLVVRAITRMAATMSRLAGGQLEEAVPYVGRGDEIGDMARALAVFKEQAAEVRIQAQKNLENVESNKRIIAVLGRGLENLSQGDLSHRIDEPFPDALDRLRSDFNSAADSLADTINSVKRGSFGIKSGTEEIAEASDNLSRRTENQAANLEETAAAVAEITATVKKTAEGAQHARNMVTAAKEDADKSGFVVRRAVEAMQSIEKSSQEITQIIGVIDEIAFQTNLLALNAGVEAARAGDAGKGFAVVASEVRGLAQRSAEAAKEIKSLLSTSRNQVQEGVQLVAETGVSLRQIIDRVTEINGVVIEIARSAEQQASGLQEVNTAVDQMDQVTQQNAAMVEQATAATRTLTQQSAELAQVVSRFTTAAAAIMAGPDAAARTPAHRPAPRAPQPHRKARTSTRPEVDWQEF